MGLCELVPQRHLTAARDIQRAALEVGPRQVRAAPWALSRRPPPALHPPFPPRERPDALLRAALPGTEQPRELAGILIANAPAAGGFVSVSKPIPFPFTLTSLTWYNASGSASAGDRLRFIITDTDPGSDSEFPNGDLIYQTPRRAAQIGATEQLRGLAIPLSSQVPVAIPVPQMNVTQAGRRIAMNVLPAGAGTPLITAVWTVRELMPA